MRLFLKNILILVFTMCVSASSMQAASVRLSVDPPRGKRSIETNDLFYITYEVSDIDAVPERPASVGGSKVMYFERTGQTSRFTSVNGKTSQSFSYIYTLTLKAQKEGSYTFGPVSVGGVKSNQVHFSIGKAAPVQNPSGSSAGGQSVAGGDDSGKPKFIGKGDGNLFLRANVSRTNVYEQEALVYTVKLFTTYDAIKFIGATAAPKFEGFVVEESKDVSSSLSYETLNGKTYATAVIARYIIFPQMTGKLKVVGNTYTISVDEREYYHDPIFGRMSMAKPLQLNVTPNDLEVNVKALPLPKPADFSGGVGSFRITSELPSRTFLSNQAASVVYTVTGTGNLKYVTLPDLNTLYPPELEVYSATPEIKVNVGRESVSGSSRFDYSFMPLETGTFDIPSVTLTYFNPSTGKYEKSVAEGFRINVGMGKGSEKSQTLARKSFDDKLMPEVQDIEMRHVPYIRDVRYWLFFMVPFLALLSAVVIYRRHLKLNADILAVKSRKAGALARRRLKKAYACLQKNDGEHFYDEILSALWGYLSDRLRMPTSELTRQNVKCEIDKKIGENTVSDRLIALIDECEFARYASQSSSSSMSDIYEEGVKVIDSLQDSFRREGKVCK